MKDRQTGDASEEPLLYYRTDEQILAYRNKPVEEKLMWLEAQMKFFHNAMPEEAKRVRDKMKRGEL